MKVHKRPDHETIYKNYEFLEHTLHLHVSGLPLTGWFFGIAKGGIVVANTTIDLEQIWILGWEKEVPSWITEISKKIEEKTGKPVHIFLP